MAIVKVTENQKYLLSVPSRTGVYSFLNEVQKPIYIGKALDLQARIKQHFQDNTVFKEKIIKSHTKFIEFKETNSEFEALILEANLIKKYLPKYNAALKDDKSPLYIVITKDKLSKIYLQRKRDIDLKQIRFMFGPMSSAKLGRLLLRKLRQTIPFCSEKRLKQQACFYHQLGLCNPCPNLIAKLKSAVERRQQEQIYRQNINRIIKILRGQSQYLLKQLNQEMRQQAKAEAFEAAAITRDRLFYLEKLLSGKLILDERLEDANYMTSLRQFESTELKLVLGMKKLKRVECYDISNLSFKEATASMVVFEAGVANKEEYRRFKLKTTKQSDPEMLSEVLKRRLKHQNWLTPDLIVIDGGTPQVLTVLKSLKKQYSSLPVIVGLAKKPDRVLLADKMQYLNLAKDSAALHYLQRIRDEAHRFAKKYHLLLRKKNFIKV